jgi:chemotaxis protein MotB
VIGPRGLVISLKDTEFFDSGKANVRARSMYLLDNITEAISKYSNSIRIEGHTDNIPIKTSQFPSNWELSTARATNIVHYLMDAHAFPPDKLSAIGYGEYRPVADNNTEEGRQKNRRVDVVVLSSAGEQGEPTRGPQPEG